MKKASRLLSWLLLVAMIASLGFASALAEEEPEAPTEEIVELDETPAEEPAEEPAEAPAEEPVEEPIEAPIEEPEEAPVEESPAEVPAEEPIEAPIEEPEEAPAEDAAAAAAIIVQPADVTAVAGGDAAFTVQVSGSVVSYQWQRSKNGKSWSNLSTLLYGAGDTLYYPASRTYDGYQFRVVVKLKGGKSLTSEAATLSVISPYIAAQPKDVTVPAGKTARFTVDVEGLVSYVRWEVSKNGGRSWSNLSTWTYGISSVISFKATEAADGWLYRAQVTCWDGTRLTSDAAKLTIGNPLAKELELDDEKIAVEVEDADGALPDGAALELKPIDEEDMPAVEAAVVDYVGGEPDAMLALDIGFGEDAEPDGDVKVTVQADAIRAMIEAGYALELLHVNAEGEAEPVDPEKVSFEEDTLTFENDEFSPYVIIGSISETIDIGNGQSLTMTIDYGEAAGIPADAELNITEIREGDEGFGYRSARLAHVLSEAYGNVVLSDARILAVSIEKDGIAYTPASDVQVTVSFDEILNKIDEDHADQYNSLVLVQDGRIINEDVDAIVSDDAGVHSVTFTADSISELDIVYLYQYQTFFSDGSAGAKAVTAHRLFSKADLRAAGRRLWDVGDEPSHSKILTDNGDGTYTIDLSVTGDADTTQTTAAANVVIIYDVSTSMTNNYAAVTTGGRGLDTSINATSYRDGFYFPLYRSTGNNSYTVIGNDTYNEGPVYRRTFNIRAGNQNRTVPAIYTRSGNTYTEFTGTPQNGATYYYQSGTNFMGQPQYSNFTWNSNSANFSVNHTEYNGERYSYSALRAAKGEQTVSSFTNALFGYSGVQVALITFADQVYINTGWRDNANAILNSSNANRFNSDGSSYNNNLYNNYTNWQAALQAAQTLITGSTTDDDPTFVVFITDGRPQTDGNDNALQNYLNATDEALAIETACYDADADTHGAFFGIYAFGKEQDWLASLMYYAYHGERPASGIEGTTFNTEGYFKASDSSALNTAINSIFQKIADTLGITAVAIADGTTSQVATSTGVAHLLEVDESSYKYYLSWAVGGSGPYTFTMADKRTGDPVNYTAAVSGSTVTITWTDPRDGSKTAIYTGKYDLGTLKVEWTEATDFYNFDPPEAELVNGSVDWDLDDVGTLLDGVTYTVSFECYPSQETLDLIADLKNGIQQYEELDDNVKLYLERTGSAGNYNYILHTNTEASLTYKDTREAPVVQHEAEYTPPSPKPVSAVETLAVTKQWDNFLDSEQMSDIELDVTRDGETYYTVSLPDKTDPDNPSWTKTVNISVGIMTVDENGNVDVKTPGHSFGFEEPSGDSVTHWELDAKTLRPMKINNVDTMLAMIDESEAPEALVSATTSKKYVVQGTGDAADSVYYKLFIGGTAYYYVVDDSTTSLDATNQRLSWLNLIKEQTSGIDPDAFFEFTVNIKEALGEDIYFTVFGGGVNYRDDITVSDNVGGFDQNVNGQNRHYYVAPSDEDFTLEVKPGWSVRFLNLGSGTEYTITETNIKSYYVFDSATSVETLYVGRDSSGRIAAEGYPKTTNFTENNITGTINQSNTDYTVRVTNKPLYFYVYHSATNKIEKIGFDDARVNQTTGAFNMVAEVGKNSDGTVNEDLLYGGYYHTYGGQVATDAQITGAAEEGALTYTNNWAADKDGCKSYDGSALYFKMPNGSGGTKTSVCWPKAQAYKEADGKGSEMAPTAGTVYYLKEVPNTFLRCYNEWVYNIGAGNKIEQFYLISAVDDNTYQKVYFTLTTVEGEIAATLYASFAFQHQNDVISDSDPNELSYAILTAAKCFPRLTRGNLAVAKWEAFGNLKDDDFEDGALVYDMTPYWKTPDGEVVEGAAREITINSLNHGDGNITFK